MIPRKAFKLITKDIIHWFPGHMGRGLRMMQQKLKTVDCVIEVHDARIPLSGNRTLLIYIFINKPSLVTFRKESRIQIYSKWC